MSICKKNLDTTNIIIFRDTNYLQFLYITVLEPKAIGLLDYINVCEVSK